MFRKIAIVVSLNLAWLMLFMARFLIWSLDLFGPNIGNVFAWVAPFLWNWIYLGSILVLGGLLLILSHDTIEERLRALEELLRKLERMLEPRGLSLLARAPMRNPSRLVGEGPPSETVEPGQRELRETQELLAEAEHTILEQAKRLAEYERGIRVGVEMRGEVKVPPQGGRQGGRDGFSDEGLWWFFGEDTQA